MTPTVSLITVQVMFIPASGVDPFLAVALNDWMPPIFRSAVDGDTSIVSRVRAGAGLTVTVALPFMVPLLAFTSVVPAADAVKLAVTFP